MIGNNRYPHLPRLETAVADAEGVADLLSKKYGFEVTLLRDANRYQILSALNAYRANLTAEDNLLIYYAGHGELDQLNQRGHWLPVDAEPDSTANWISNADITDILNAVAAKHVLVVADSCYSGSLTRASLTRLGTGLTESEWIARLRALGGKRSRTALTSGGLQPTLDSGGGQNSVFAKAFLAVLAENEGLLEGQRVHRGSPGAGHLRGRAGALRAGARVRADPVCRTRGRRVLLRAAGVILAARVRRAGDPPRQSGRSGIRKLVPAAGLEPATSRLQGGCSTVELRRPALLPKGSQGGGQGGVRCGANAGRRGRTPVRQERS